MMLSIHLDQDAAERLQRAADELGRTIEDLAAAAASEAALEWERQNQRNLEQAKRCGREGG